MPLPAGKNDELVLFATLEDTYPGLDEDSAFLARIRAIFTLPSPRDDDEEKVDEDNEVQDEKVLGAEELDSSSG